MPLAGPREAAHRSRIDSSATASEGKQNLLCAYLAAALLVGLLGNALFGAWWLDPLVGLFIAVVAVAGRPRGLARRRLLRSLRLGGPHRRSGRYSYERQPNRPVMTGRPRSTSTPQTGTTSPTTRPRRDTSHQAPANETPDRPARPLRHVNQAETVGVGTPPLRMAQGLKKSPGKKWTVGAGPPPFPPPPSGGGRSPSPVPRSRWVDSADLCARARRRVL